MTKQEMIRARVRGAVDLAQGYVKGCCPIDDITDSLITELNSQGVVIKVETWLPTRSDMTCTIEPLIKEVNAPLRV